MAKFIWFLVTLVAFILVLSLGSFRGIPVDNEKFQVKRRRELALEAERKKRVEEARKLLEQGVKEEPELVLVLDTPQLKNGHEVYFKKGKCITCHGKKGEGKPSQKAPKLAAQHDWYLYETLIKFKSRERMNKKMEPYLRNLSDQDFRDVATYLSKLPPQ